LQHLSGTSCFLAASAYLLAKGAARLKAISKKLSSSRSYDEAAATWHARERTRLESIGRPTPFADGQIAAIASVNELVLVTANTRDFAPYKGLAIEDWSTARSKK
jgi:predicted nucleic acid-binding protein